MEQQQPVAGVVLAAGESRRFGSPKQLARLGERTLLEHVLETARAAGLSPVVAVVPVWLTRPSAMDDPSLLWVRNPHPERGMSSSLGVGFGALPADVTAAVILLADQPTLSVEHVHALLRARGDRPIVASRSRGRLMPPVLLERNRFEIVGSVRGDVGLREALAAHPEAVRAVDVGGDLPDVDSPGDLARLDNRDG